MAEKHLTEVIFNSIKGRERTYVQATELEAQFKKLVEYAISNRVDRPVHQDELVASKLISDAMSGVGYAIRLALALSMVKL